MQGSEIVMPNALTTWMAQRLRRPIPSGLTGAALWLTVGFVLLRLLRMVPGGWGNLFLVLQVVDGIALAAVVTPLLWRFVVRRLLWSLRSKLILTYLLFGLAPIVLFGTLVFFVSYLAAGQFAIHLADSRIQAEVAQISMGNARRVTEMAQALGGRPMPEHIDGPSLFSDALLNDVQAAQTEVAAQNGPVLVNAPRPRLRRHTAVFLDGAPVVLDIGTEAQGQARAPFGLPAWATTLQGEHMSGVVLDDGHLFLVALDQRRVGMGQNRADRHRLTVESSVVVDEPFLSIIAGGLGRTSLTPSLLRSESSKIGGIVLRPISSGVVPSAVNVADINVRFPSTLEILDWETGQRNDGPIEVSSRPSLLSRQLFGGSIGGIYTSVYFIVLGMLVVLCALVEALALYMALRVSRSITSAVADLYAATLSIDRGDFNNRIRVASAERDQLAELGISFNKMTGSLQRLLEEQKEKERLQNELSIAQEVQANLFPHADCDLANLQLHGVCRPARSVSGDYYDFLVFHKEAHEGNPSRVETGVGIALGDISGKGISAALLMAMLHSAVRAYRFASEELVYSENAVEALTASREALGEDSGAVFQSPGRILSLLNRHLYRSTQAEKYATLFLAHYDADSAVLTYSNAGQLPPFVLSRDGSLRRLDKGGTVVGLMDGMRYDEARFKMLPGDILIAYSDGVTEPENDFGDFGEERLIEVVERYREEPLEVISAQVMQALDAWIGAEEQPDDITLVLARQM
jgi:phosphoserine phosphatase RsbU/P